MGPSVGTSNSTTARSLLLTARQIISLLLNLDISWLSLYLEMTNYVLFALTM